MRDGCREAEGAGVTVAVNITYPPYTQRWRSCDGLSEVAIRVLPPSPPWPAMVSVEADIGSCITEGDAVELASCLFVASAQARAEQVEVA